MTLPERRQVAATHQLFERECRRFCVRRTQRSRRPSDRWHWPNRGLCRAASTKNAIVERTSANYVSGARASTALSCRDTLDVDDVRVALTHCQQSSGTYIRRYRRSSRRHSPLSKRHSVSNHGARRPRRRRMVHSGDIRSAIHTVRYRT